MSSAAFLAAAFFLRISDDRKSALWSRDFNAPGRSIGYSARRAHRLDLREAYLVSVTEFAAGSSGFSIGFLKQRIPKEKALPKNSDSSNKKVKTRIG